MQWRRGRAGREAEGEGSVEQPQQRGGNTMPWQGQPKCQTHHSTGLVGSSVHPQVPAILVSSLHKEYDERREFLLGRRIKKVATKHVSLCIRKGSSWAVEVLGGVFWFGFFFFFWYVLINWSDLTGNVLCCYIFRRNPGVVGTQWSWEKHTD